MPKRIKHVGRSGTLVIFSQESLHKLCMMMNSVPKIPQNVEISLGFVRNDYVPGKSKLASKNTSKLHSSPRMIALQDGFHRIWTSNGDWEIVF
jgi:hypothetical protein